MKVVGRSDGGLMGGRRERGGERLGHKSGAGISEDEVVKELIIFLIVSVAEFSTSRQTRRCLKIGTL